MSRGVGALSGGVPPPETAPMDGGRGKPLPYDKSRTASVLRRGAPWGSRQDTHQERWLGKARRSSGTATILNFANPGPGGPEGIAKSHSNFARRKFLPIPRGNPRNGVRGKRPMDLGGAKRSRSPSDASPGAFCLLCRHGQSRSPPRIGVFRKETCPRRRNGSTAQKTNSPLTRLSEWRIITSSL